MFRYYMTPETRQAVIAESNRLIAKRAALHAARKQQDAEHAGDPGDGETFAPQGDTVESHPGPGSAFARLVSDLQLTALRTTSRAAPAARA